jgi:hypothetical protein
LFREFAAFTASLAHKGRFSGGLITIQYSQILTVTAVLSHFRDVATDASPIRRTWHFSDRSLHRPWKGPDQPLVIGLALQVGGCGRLGPGDAVVDRQPNQHNAIADVIGRSPPQTTHRFEHRVLYLPNGRRLDSETASIKMFQSLTRPIRRHKSGKAHTRRPLA